MEFSLVAFSVLMQSFLLTVLHELRLIHTDLKPENILLVDNEYKTLEVPVRGELCLTRSV